MLGNRLVSHLTGPVDAGVVEVRRREHVPLATLHGEIHLAPWNVTVGIGWGYPPLILDIFDTHSMDFMVVLW